MLPSGPGGVQRIPLRGAQPSTPFRMVHSTRATLERGFNPAIADCGLQGTATSPSSTAKPRRVAIRVHLLRWRARSSLNVQRVRLARRFARRLAAEPFSPPGKVFSPSEIGSICFVGALAPRSTYREYASLVASRAASQLGPSRQPARSATSGKWRRGWDSNPRYSCPYTAFPVPHLRPLGHPS